MTTVLLSILLSVLPSVKDTLQEAVVVSSVKQSLEIAEISSPVTSLMMSRIEDGGINSPRDLSLIVPGLLIPDYGSAMTSSVYMRGLGSRIDNPVVGLYIDDVPVLDKNNYDFQFLDVRRVDMYRGPQGTLYGRNSMTGILSVETLTPSAYQGIRGGVEYGSAATVSARASVYKGRSGAVVGYRHSNGFYTNDFTGEDCDRSDALYFRMRCELSREKVRMDNSFSVSFHKQGGYPYRLWDDGELLPVNYNDKSAYKRISVTDGFRAGIRGNGWNLSSVTSIQLLFDSMDLDQDFTTASMFTLNQTQRQYAATQELIFRPEKGPSWWTSQTGFFAFVKKNRMSAPVVFLEDGIRTLILDNANAGIPDSFGELGIMEDNFPISSEFGIFTYNAALYHESCFRFGRWLLTAGLRIDHEGNFMDYDSRADIHFILSPTMKDYYPLTTRYKGDITNFYFQVLPKLSALYNFGRDGGPVSGQVFATVSRGYRSGGFNTQIFSDILQNQMMQDMMGALGVHPDLDGNAPDARNTTYKPETCMNYEAGARMSLNAGGHRLSASASLFWLDCRNQQITVFPSGKGTGRMMANAGRSRSRGLEAEASWSWKGLTMQMSGSLLDAVFKEYDDGIADYSGNRVPYSPGSTLTVAGSYRFPLGGKHLRSFELSADVSRIGSIVWDEAGTFSQGAYTLLGASARLSMSGVSFFVRGLNLTGTEYDTFYFKSVGNSFFQTGKPRRFTAGVEFEF